MDLSEFEKDNTKNCILESGPPEETFNEPCWLGIDEAGRGPVLGPMVYGTCYSPISQKEKLKEMGFADSKTLTEEKREELFEVIDKSSDTIGWIVDILSPQFISNSMLRRSKYNLNALSHDTAIGLIQKVLDKGVNLKEVYVDTVGPPDKYQDKLKGIFPDLDVTVAKKADSLYTIVSAASICAKVARDLSVKRWDFGEGHEIENYGSGYPSDPATKKFMSENIDSVFGYPSFVRFSWSTADLLLQKKAALVQWEDDEEDDDEKTAKAAPSVMSFFTAKPNRKRKHSFFTERCLKTVSKF